MEQTQRDKLITDNFGLIHKACKAIRVPPQHYEDCFQEGVIGLIYAIDKFDPESGYALSTYAYPCIHGRIAQYLRDKSKLIRLPRSLTKMSIEYFRLTGQGYSDEEICKKLNVQPDHLLSAINGIASLDYQDEESGRSRYDTVGEPDNYDNIYCRDVDLALQYVLKHAPQHVKDIYEEYIFSILYDEPVSQEYLSNKYGKSQPQVSRIIRKYNNLIKELL